MCKDEMINPKVSIIIPVYNVQTVLRKCIESVKVQTFVDIEIILVDDGSTDDSGELCDVYAKDDDRIKVIHQKNEGVSSARNTGIKCSKGDFVLFVDSDDYIDMHYVENMYMNRSNLTICGLEKRKENEEILSTLKYEWAKLTSKQEIDYVNLMQNTDFFSPYCKLFDLHIIKSNNIMFPPNVHWGEDGIFVAEYIQYVETVNVLEYVGYYYVRYEKENNLSTQIRDNIIDTIVFSRTCCLKKMMFVSEEDYQKIKCFIYNNVKKNCAYFVCKLLESKTLSIKKKCELLNLFMKNSYVLETFQSDALLYPSIMRRCFRWKKAYQIILAYELKMKRRKSNIYIKQLLGI